MGHMLKDLALQAQVLKGTSLVFHISGAQKKLVERSSPSEKGYLKSAFTWELFFSPLPRLSTSEAL